MLSHLSVRNFAVVEAAEIDFGTGLTVVTGETGAGKSLLVDALSLLCGTRADTGMVRTGCARAELAAEFTLDAAADARSWLAEQALDDEEGLCRVRRVVAAEGGSRTWINGRAASLTQLSALMTMLVEIHGQHEHQALLGRTRQLTLLDVFGRHAEGAAAAAALARRHHQLAVQERQLAGGEDRTRRIELLRHEVADLERWALPPDALAELEARHKRLANAGKLAAATAGLAELLDGDGEFTAVRAVTRVRQELERLVELDPALQSTADLLDGVGIQLDEAAETLARYAEHLDLDPERYAEADAHLAALHDLARRHHIRPDQLHGQLAACRDQLHALEGAGEELSKLAAALQQCHAEYTTAAKELSQQRKDAAQRLGHAVTTLMGELGMEGGSFAVALAPQPAGAPDPLGLERCEFMVSANPGSPRRALRKVASGGELSRIGLAIEVATLGAGGAGTMVFDEVDAGVGGAVAETVGVKLRALSGRRQVLCVTHLPQVAAQGHAHLSVVKSTSDETTHTRVAALDAAGRREELARMLGGIEIDRATRVHAQRMLEKAGTRDPGPGTR